MRRRLRLRPARPSDARAIAAVMRSAIRRLARGTCTARQLAAWSSLPPLYHAWAMSAGGEEYVVAEEGGLVVGYAARRGREVTAVFVHPSRTRRGLGGRLLAAVERRIARDGHRSASVRAAPGAVAFYAAMGFRGGRRVRVPLPGGAALPSSLMRKVIAGARSLPRMEPARR